MDAPSISEGDHKVTEGGELIPDTEGTDGQKEDRKSVDDKSVKEESISEGDHRVTEGGELIPDTEGTDGLIVSEDDRKSVDEKSGKEERISEGDHRVTVGVVLIPDTEGSDCLIVGEDGKSVDYKSGTEGEEERSSFSFDQVRTLDNIQTIHPGFLQTLIEAISSGYNGTLLIGGNPRTGKDGFQIDHGIIKQVLTGLFGHMSSAVKGELLSTVSCVQFYPDYTAVDVLNSGRQALKPVCHPILGCVVGGLCEASVCSAEEAFSLYETGTQTMKDNAGILFSRCTSLFSVAIEWKIIGEEADPEFHRVRLQMFSLAGGASKNDLRGVSPLVKVLDQIQSGAATSDKLLPFLLMDALKGNSKTVFLCCIQPQGLLDEVPSGLELAQRVRGFMTKTTDTRWCPRSTELEIRKDILELRTEMSRGEGGVQNNTHRLAELINNLQMVKNQSWEKRREKAEKIKDRIMGCTPPPPGDHSTDNRETSDRMKYLEEQLRREMQDHIREGKGSVEKVQERVARIQQLREALREEMAKHDFATEKSDLSQQSQSEYSKAKERRRQLKQDHDKLIQEEVERMENERSQEQVEGLQRELLVLTRERRVLVLQMEALGSDGLQTEKDLEDQYWRHQEELHCLRQESLQVFRVFRQVSEEQRRLSEGRYRTLLLEAVQDAVYLSAQNQQLQADNKQLRAALGELKDALAVQGDHKTEPSSQQQ